MDGLEAKFRIRVDGKDELTDFFSGGERGAKSMQSTIRGALADTVSTIKGFVSGLAKDALGASGLKLGIAGNARQVLEFRDALQQLVVSAGVGDDQIAGLKKQILDTAGAANQMEGDVAGALQAFVEKTGDLDTARKNLMLYAQTATATRAALEDVANVGVQLSDKLGVHEQANSFAVLAAQAKKGAIELKDMAQYAPRVFSAGAAAGLSGEKGVREAGALMQIGAKAFGGRGSGANVATAVENVFRDIAKKADKIEQGGIKVAGRDPIDVLFDIVRKTGGDSLALARTKIFDARSTRLVNILANEYKATGGFGTYESFRDVTPAPGIIASDAARQMSTGLAKLKASQIAIQRSSEENLGGAADFLAKHSDLIAGSYNAVTAHPFISAGAGAAGLFGLNMLRRGVLGGGRGGLAGGLFGGGGPTPVVVTNWPAQLGGGTGGVPGGSAGVAAKALPLIGAGLAAETAINGLLGQVKVGGGLKWSDLTNGFGVFDTKKAQQAMFDKKAELYNSFVQQNAAAAQVQNNIKVEIKDGKATVTDGTRSTQVMVNRTTGDE